MHIRQQPSGKWRWIVQHRGDRRDGTSPTKGEATLDASRALLEIGATRQARVDMTVKDLLDVWQAERQRDWSPTYAADIAAVTAKLPATFLGRDIGEVRPQIVAGLLRELTKDGWSPHRVSRANVAVSQAFTLGVEHGWVETNPARDVRPPRARATEIEPPPETVVTELIAAMPKKIRLIVRLAALTGARLGELVALTWADVDGNVLTVRRAVVYTPRSGTVIRDTTKSGRKGDRRLELDDDTVAMLAAHREELRVTAVKRLLPEPVYVFSHYGIEPWRPGYVGLAFRRARAQVDGAAEVRFHDLRHYVATQMLADGEHPVAVAAQLGHSSTTTTMRVYAHYLPGQGGDSVRRRAARLKG
jgi:integrase